MARRSKRAESRAPAEEKAATAVLWKGKPSAAAFFQLYVMGILAVLLSLAWPVLLLISVPACAILFALSVAIRRAYTFEMTDAWARLEFRFWATRDEQVPLSRVTDVVGEQDFVGRALHYGTVRFDTAGTPYPGLKFWGLADHRKVLALAREAIERAPKKS